MRNFSPFDPSALSFSPKKASPVIQRPMALVPTAPKSDSDSKTDSNKNPKHLRKIARLNENAIVTSGLSHAFHSTFFSDSNVLYLDPSLRDCYPGYGYTLFDLSTHHNNFALPSSGNTAVLSDGTISCDINSQIIGPPSDRFLIEQDHTLIVVAKTRSQGINSVFLWLRDNAQNGNVNMMLIHLPYSNQYIYYDTHGVPGTGVRVYYRTGDYDRVVHYVFRTRTHTFPNRQVFENGEEKVNSGNEFTETRYEWGGPSYLNQYWRGDIYHMSLFNRALSDEEIESHYQWSRARFPICR